MPHLFAPLYLLTFPSLCFGLILEVRVMLSEFMEKKLICIPILKDDAHTQVGVNARKIFSGKCSPGVGRVDRICASY